MSKITLEKDDYVIVATITPSKLGKFFGKKEKVRRFKKDPIHQYLFTGEPVYIENTGEDLEPLSKLYKKIKCFERSW